MTYTDLRDRLREELKKKLLSMDASECTLEAYEKTNWQYIQAHKNGYRSCCRQFLKLMDIIDQEVQNERNTDGRPTTTGTGNRPE